MVGESLKRERSNEQVDYVAHYRACASHRKECDYLTHRGISDGVQSYYMVGYCQKWANPDEKGQSIASPHMIIPTSRHSYVAIDVNTGNMVSVGKTHIFNDKAIEKEDNKPTIVVMDVMDALSVIEAGYKSIALGSDENCGELLELLKEHRPSKPVLVALSKDYEDTKKKLMASLADRKIECYEVNIIGEYKNTNEYLMNNSKSFKNALSVAIKISTAEPDKTEKPKQEKVQHERGKKEYELESLCGLQQKKQEEIDKIKEMYRKQQQAVKASGNMKADILQGLKKREPVEKLLLEACNIISLMTGDRLFAQQVESDLIAIYGEGLNEEQPLKYKLEQVEQRLENMKQAITGEMSVDTKRKVEQAIATHEKERERIKGLIEKE